MGTAVRPAKTSPGPWDAFAEMQAVTRHTDPSTLLGYIRMQNLVKEYPRQILR